MSGLKPCPLCGHFAVEWPEDEWGDTNSVACDATDCGVCVEDCEAPMDVLVDRWNSLPRLEVLLPIDESHEQYASKILADSRNVTGSVKL